MGKGFTLIELLVVISIIGLLSSVILSSLNSARAKAEDSKHVQSLSQLKRAMELYYDANNGLYPDLPVANATWRLNSWDSTGNFTAPYDASKLSVIQPYLTARPSGKPTTGFAWSGYYYKVSTDRKDYKISLVGTMNNTSNIPTPMTDTWFTGGTAVASVWSSDTAKTWVWWTNPI